MELLSAKITFNFREENVVITVHDDTAVKDIIQIVMTPWQYVEAMGGTYRTECSATVSDLDKVGKKMQTMGWTTVIPDDVYATCDKDKAMEYLRKDLLDKDMGDWIPDTTLSSRDSFYKDINCYVRTIIRRWVPIEQPGEQVKQSEDSGDAE